MSDVAQARSAVGRRLSMESWSYNVEVPHDKCSCRCKATATARQSSESYLLDNGDSPGSATARLEHPDKLPAFPACSTPQAKGVEAH